MPRRLPGHDAVRGPAVELKIGGATLRAFADESVAAAALASGVRVLSRSLKYHRPRSYFCLEGHCGGCLVRLDGVPNIRACQSPCTSGAEVAGQNAYPSAEHDLLGAVDFVFARGMDHHTLMTGSTVLNRLANKVVRQLSGLGKLPAVAATDLPECQHREVDAAVIGGGPAGLAAATTLGRAGKRVVLVDDQLAPGGSLRADPRTGRAVADSRVAEALAAGVEIVPRATAIAFFPEDLVVPRPPSSTDGEDARGVLAVATPAYLLRVHARAYLWATGGYAVNLPFVDNDRPGVLAARAVGRLLVEHGILAGERVCIVAPPADARPGELAADVAALAAALTAAGAEVVHAVAPEVIKVRGRGWVSGVDVTTTRIDCDAVAVAAIPSPASEGPRQQGCRVVLDPAAGGFRVVVDDDGRTTAPDVWSCGDVCGYRGPAAAAAHGAHVGAAIARALGRTLG